MRPKRSVMAPLMPLERILRCSENVALSSNKSAELYSSSPNQHFSMGPIKRRIDIAYRSWRSRWETKRKVIPKRERELRPKVGRTRRRWCVGDRCGIWSSCEVPPADRLHPSSGACTLSSAGKLHLFENPVGRDVSVSRWEKSSANMKVISYLNILLLLLIRHAHRGAIFVFQALSVGRKVLSISQERSFAILHLSLHKRRGRRQSSLSGGH